MWMEFGWALRSMFLQTIPYIRPVGREPDGSPSAPDFTWSVYNWTKSPDDPIDKPANLVVLPNWNEGEKEEMLTFIHDHNYDHEIEGTFTKNLAIGWLTDGF